MMKYAVFWFRRDLRLEDNRGLYEALNSGLPVIPIFIFDKNILDDLPSKDARVTFIYREVDQIKKQLKERGSDLLCFYSTPEEAFSNLLEKYPVSALYFNSDYEPYANRRDGMIHRLLKKKAIEVFEFKDHVIFEKDEVLKDDGNPYVVFTPFKRKWVARLERDTASLTHYPSEKCKNNFWDAPGTQMIKLSEIGFVSTFIDFPEKQISSNIIRHYDETRDYPGLENGTSRLGIHFRFGTISIREKVRKSARLNEVYLSELIWREFYSQILAHFPRVVEESFRQEYDRIEWRNNETEFDYWCRGQTGFPLVDAGMRQLNATGYMHNRVRMVTASFLTKHLLIDWRWGEAYFAEKLLDYELASNNGGWQWAAGCGTDAAPYFRIFNPTTQLKKFDSNLTYVKKWISEYGTTQYPKPIVDHKEARERCLQTYRKALQ